MLRRYNLGTLVVLAGIAELVTFVVVVDCIGFGPALLLSFGATFLGLNRLRRLGSEAFGRLREVASGTGSREDAFVDGALAAVGAVLLILPGFLTDAVGLALLAPSVRDTLKRRIGLSTATIGTARSAGPRTIDLEAQDWSRLDRMRPR